MTRRQFASAVLACAPLQSRPVAGPVSIPLHRVTDARATISNELFHYFWGQVWPQCVRDFGRCGVAFRCTDAAGEIRRSPGGNPIFVGLQRGALNLVITREIPLNWARGRGIAGATLIHEGQHLCIVALEHAHTHRVPLVAVNTCVHEMLHAVLGDIFEGRPRGVDASLREFRIDRIATQMWLGGGSAVVRDAADRYIRRL